jgi:hypothetical protein
MGRACSTNGEKRTGYMILIGNQEEKRPLGRPLCRWEHIFVFLVVSLDLNEI